MSNDEPTLYERGEVPQFGQDIKEPGEPFGDGTLDTIRSLVAEDDTVAGVGTKATAHADVATECTPAASKRANIAAQVFGRTAETQPEPVASEPRSATGATETDWHDWANAPGGRNSSWRKLEIVEGGPSRALRRFLTTPRLLSILFLSGVVYWKPLFIPILALVLVSIPLLIGALIGQDRVGRFVLRRVQRFVWKRPDLARMLEKVTPRRRHHLFHRPASEKDVWDGPIDPAFAERLSRIRY